MKKIMCVCTVVVAAIICIYSCKKTSVPETVLPITTDEMAGAKSWLLQQRSSAPDKNWFDSLMSGIDWPKAEVTEFKDNQLLITLPVHLSIWRNFSLKYLSVATNSTATQLVLIADKKSGIQSGNLVQLTPTANSSDAGSKASLLNKLFRFSPDNDHYNGYFTVSTVMDTLMYEYKFNNGQKETYSQRQLKSKADPVSPGTKANDAVLTKAMTPPPTASTCIDWYWTTVWYNEVQQVIATEETYLYTTCSGNTLGSPNPCSGPTIDNFNQEANGGFVDAETLSSDIIDIDQFTKYKNPKWICYDGFGGWHLVSHETGIIKLIDVQQNKWAWVSLTHSSMSMIGSPLAGAVVAYSQGVGTPSFTPETAATRTVLYAGMSVDYTTTISLGIANCPLITPKSVLHTSNNIWDANPF